jgi:hypothetical protein
MVVYKELVRLRESNIPTEKQVLSMLKWGDIIKVRDGLEYGSNEHLLLCMHTYVPPRRQLDYARMRVYTDPDVDPLKDENYCQLFNRRLGAPVLFYHEYKNAKYFRDFLNKEVPIELLKVVASSLEKYPREYLFVNQKSGDLYNTQVFTTFANRVLKKVFDNEHVSVNTLRHSFVNYIARKQITFSDRKRIARKMGHTLSKSMEYVLYNKKTELIRAAPLGDDESD